MIGILLHIEEYRSHTQRGIWLHSEGLQTTFLRISSKKQTPTPPLFGTSELAFKSKSESGDAEFISEWECLRDRQKLSRPYRRLQVASYFAIFLRENAGLLPEPEPIFELATTVFDSLETASEPLSVIFKALYKTALMEGFPVKEEWLSRESRETITLARDLLKNPLSSPAVQSISAQQLNPLLSKLLAWLTHHTEFRLPANPLSIS